MPMNLAKRPLSLLFALAASAVLLLTLLADNGSMNLHAQSADTPTPEPAAEPGFDIGEEQLPPIEGKLNPPKYPNMDSNLNRIVEQVESGQFTAQAAAANAPIHREESVAVTLYITEGYAQDVWHYLEQSGASPRNIGRWNIAHRSTGSIDEAEADERQDAAGRGGGIGHEREVGTELE